MWQTEGQGDPCEKSPRPAIPASSNPDPQYSRQSAYGRSAPQAEAAEAQSRSHAQPGVRPAEAAGVVAVAVAAVAVAAIAGGIAVAWGVVAGGIAVAGSVVVACVVVAGAVAVAGGIAIATVHRAANLGARIAAQQPQGHQRTGTHGQLPHHR